MQTTPWQILAGVAMRVKNKLQLSCSMYPVELCGRRIFFLLVLSHCPVGRLTLLLILLQQKLCLYSIACLFTIKPLLSPT